MKKARTSLFLVVALGLFALCPVGLADEFADKSVPLFCAVGWLGEFTHIDPSIGEVPPTRNDLPSCLQALAWSPSGTLYAGRENGLYTVGPWTGDVNHYISINSDIRGMAFSPSGVLYVTAEVGLERYLRTIDLNDGSYTQLCKLSGAGRFAQGLAFSPTGTLYGIGRHNNTEGAYDLFTIYLDDYEQHLIATHPVDTSQSITFTADGRLYAIGEDVFAQLNPADGSIIGSPVILSGEYRGLAIVPPMVYYVDDDAMGANNGSSWHDAHNYLQDALNVAYSGDEVRVAQGIYTPDSNSANPNGSGDRTATFQLKNGVTLKGGYAGAGTPDPNARDIELYKTILSGDLNGDDVAVNDPCDLPDEPTKAENSYHVVTGTGTDKTAILDGFTITGGNANGPHDPYRFEWGGGMYCNLYSSPTVINCTFRGNIAVGGGGLYIYWDENMVLTNCAFIGNYAGCGGGMQAMRSRVTLTNCAFSGNAAQNGGGMCNQDGGPTLTNCTFSANSAAGSGGGMVNFMSSPTMINCTFTGNSAEYGGAINSFLECTTVFTNSILWANTAAQGSQICLEEDPHYSSNASISYCNIEGGITGVYVGEGCRLNWGQGNIDSDPLFRDPDGNDDIPGTEDDNLRLSAASPCIDAGDPNYIAEPNETDLDGNPRVIRGRIDMGAYETPIPAEVRIVPRTINLASKGNWITCYISLPEDYDVADIDPNSVLLEGEIKPEEFSVDQQKQVAVLRFSRSDVQPILEVGDIDLTIIGRLTDGTAFDATDTIKVIDKARKK